MYRIFYNFIFFRERADMVEPSGYKITVEGQYFVVAGENRKSLKSYHFDINMPSMDSALSVIKNKILDVILPKLYPDYAGYRTHNIVDVQPFGNVPRNKAELWQMNRPTVISYINEYELPVIEHIYETLMELRQAVQMAEADPDNFQRVQADKEKDYKLTSELRILNPDLYSKPEEEKEQVPGGSWNQDQGAHHLKSSKEHADALSELMA